MSTERSIAEERISVESDGIGVLKELELEEFSIPVVRFVIVSNREETVSIRLVDEIPETMAMDDVSFHPDYESDNWTRRRSHEAEFQRTIDPVEEVETVYGVRIERPSEARAFLTEPEITEIRPEGAELQLGSSAETVDEATIEEISPGEVEEVQDLVDEKTDGEVGPDDDATRSGAEAETPSSDPTDDDGLAEPGTDLDLDTDFGSVDDSTGHEDGESDTSFGNMDTDTSFDGFDDGLSTDRDSSDEFSIDLEGTDGSTVEHGDGLDGVREPTWGSSGIDDGDYGLGRDPTTTVEFDWTDLPPDVREEAIGRLTSDVELSVPLESMVQEAIEQRVDQLFDDLDEERLRREMAAAIADEHLDAIGERIAAELADREAVPLDPESTSKEPLDSVTLLVNGERYHMTDGDTFGRREAPWFEDLVEAAGDEKTVSYISSQHVEFSIEDGDAFVEDMSRNGTTVNGTDLSGEKTKLEDGDTLVLAGVAKLEVEL